MRQPSGQDQLAQGPVIAVLISMDAQITAILAVLTTASQNGHLWSRRCKLVNALREFSEAVNPTVPNFQIQKPSHGEAR